MGSKFNFIKLTFSIGIDRGSSYYKSGANKVGKNRNDTIASNVSGQSQEQIERASYGHDDSALTGSFRKPQNEGAYFNQDALSDDEDDKPRKGKGNVVGGQNKQKNLDDSN